MNEKIAVRASRNTIILNVCLSALKMSAGIFAHSSAMVSDAVHSLADVGFTAIVIAGVKLSARASDKEHPFGHERFESIAAMVLSAVLAVTGISIGWAGIGEIFSASGAKEAPGAVALAAAAVSVTAKEVMFRRLKAAARKTNSGALTADAWHQRSDALSSVASLAGVAGARLGFPMLDSAASVVICLFILTAALSVFRSASAQLTDRACPDELVTRIEEAIKAQQGVLRLDHLRTRLFGGRVLVEAEIGMDGSVTLYAAHETAELVRRAIKRDFPVVKRCLVHVSPMDEPGERGL